MLLAKEKDEGVEWRGAQAMKSAVVKSRLLKSGTMKSGPLVVPSSEEILAGPNIECLEAPQSWTRPAADFVVDLSDSGVDHYLSSPIDLQRHGTYRNRFSDVLVFGYNFFHGVLSRSGRIECQDIENTRERLKNHLLYHPGRDMPIPQIYETDQGFRADCAAIRPKMLGGTLHFGTPIEPLNWGMWLLQAIPAAMDFLSVPKGDRFLAYMDRDWQRHLLNALGIPDKRLVHQELARTYHCNDLVFHQYSDVDLVPTPRERETFAKVARDVAGVRKPQAKRRLFLSRRSITQESEGTYRALLNEDALVEAFSARGYEIVEPELLSFPDQIRLFAEAELVVGLGGAALFNVIFSTPETRIVTIESSASFVHAHACLFGALDHPYGVVFGQQDAEDETPVQKRWTVNVEGVVQAVAQYE
jgi:capsular polysaccharide biosynthesis protein